MTQIYKVPLVLTPQPEGGYTITSPALPELVTEGDTLAEAIESVRDALEAVMEVYDDLSTPLPANIERYPDNAVIGFEHLIIVE